MSSSDHDEPRGSRRRRGRRGDEFEDFWTRDNGGAPGKGRRRADGRPGPPEPGDVSDLSGETRAAPAAPLPRRDVSPGGRAARPGIGRSDPARGPAGGSAWVDRDPSYGARSPGPARDLSGRAGPAGPARPPAGGRGVPGTPRGARAPLGPPPRASGSAPRPSGAAPGRGGPPGGLRSPTSGEVVMPAGAGPVRGPATGASGSGRARGPRSAGGWPGDAGPPGPAAPRSAAGRGTYPPGRTTATGGWRASELGPEGPPSPPRGMPAPDPADYPPTAQVPTYDAPSRRRRGWDDAGLPDAGYSDDTYGDDTYYDDYADDDPGEDDGGGEDLPKRRGCRNALIVFAVLLVALAGACWYGWSWVQSKIDPPGPPGEEVLVVVPEGTSTAGVGDVLAEAGVISDAGVWNWYTKLRDVGTIQAGSYVMRLDSSFTEAIDDLAAEPLPPESRLVTVPEGLTQEQIVARLADPENGVPGFTVQGMEAALADPASRSPVIPADQPLLEGVLFPETYTVEEGDTELIVVRRMVDQFEEVAEDLELAARAEALGRTPYEVLIVASMIEREAGTPEDGPRVARVIYNRLEQDIALGIDATSCYEVGEIPCELTTEILNDNTPYDTRAQLGLPPTPIASPGAEAIEAALNPAEGNWIYYILDVTKDDGSSVFTDSAAEFEEAKDRCVAAGRCG